MDKAVEFIPGMKTLPWGFDGIGSGCDCHMLRVGDRLFRVEIKEEFMTGPDKVKFDGRGDNIDMSETDNMKNESTDNG